MTLSERILNRLAQNPDKKVFSDRFGACSAGQIETQISEIHRHLDRLTRPGDRIAICLPNSSALAIALLAIVTAQRVPVFEPDTAALIIGGFGGQNESSLTFIEIDENAQVLQIMKKDELSRKSFKPAFLALQTSGSMGEPKTVRLGENGLSYIIDTLIERFSLDDHAVTPVILPMNHTFALNTQFFPVFLAGGTCVFLNPALEFARLFKIMIDTRATFVSLVGRLLFQNYEEKNRYRLPSAVNVTDVQLAGDIVSNRQLDLAHELFPHARIHIGYGSTETIRVAMTVLERGSYSPGLCGSPLLGETVEIRDGTGKVLRNGEIGEIFVRGPNLMLGYDDGSDGATEALAPPAGPIGADGFYGMGDVGSMRDSVLTFSGRKDRLFKCNGLMVVPIEIERRLLANEIVKSAICRPLPDEKSGHVPLVFVDVDSVVFNSQNEFNSAVQSLASSVSSLSLPIRIILGPLIFESESGQAASGKIADSALIARAEQVIGKGSPVANVMGSLFWRAEE